MEEMWDDIQAGKVKRKDVIKRFMEEVKLIPKGAVPPITAQSRTKLSNTA